MRQKALLGLLILFLHFSSGHAQQDSVSLKSAFLVGASFWGKLNYVKFEDYRKRVFQLESDFKFGYYLTNSDLIIIKLESSVDTDYSFSSTHKDIVSRTDIVLNYRKYLCEYYFIGGFLGADYDYFSYSALSKTIDRNKAIKFGLELGITHFITPDVGIDLSTFYAINRIRFERDNPVTYNYSRFGIRIGLVYLFKRT